MSTELMIVGLAVAGLVLFLSPSPAALLRRFLPSGRAAGVVDDPDDRKAFSDRLYWLTEFARNELRDAEMVEHLNEVHDRFTRVPEEKAEEAGDG